jgi:virulence factor
MLKIGIIGLGDIAQKAYLPVIASLHDIEVHLFTRNVEKLTQISNKYRFAHTHTSLSSLINSGINGAFVHSSTESHEVIVKELLENNIHVYVDKPITYHYDTTKQLVELADARNLNLMTGFNRRYAPFYRSMSEIAEPNMVLLQKNRHSQPGDIRTFVFDDFIHCIDTVRYLMNEDIQQIIVNGRKKDGLLFHVVVQFVSENMTGMAIMNRDSGAGEEKLEVIGPAEKRMVNDLERMTILKGNQETDIGFNNWDSTLYKRGFEQIIAEFLDVIRTNSKPSISANDALKTHEICESIVQQLENS